MKKIAAGFERNEDQLDTQEDAPMVAGVVDERSEEIKTKQDFVESSKWKRLGFDEGDKGNPKLHYKLNIHSNILPFTPSGQSVTARKEKHGYDSDHSPPRRRRNDSDSDPSPPRRKRNDSDSDPSPPRRKRNNSDSDPSPPRRKQLDSDSSPPRRPIDTKSRKRHDSGSDLSPPRKGRGPQSDQSPPRKRHDSGSDLSPPRRRNQDTRTSPTRTVKRDSDGDLSPVRPKTSRDGESGKLTKTLDGKRAGIQTGRALREETKELRRREEEAFNKMDRSLTGENAATAVRAGKLREMEAKQNAAKEKAEKLAKLQEAYNKWNKGLKQGEEQSNRLAEDVHEMSKPLARFAGDDDLEKMLREQDREGDPMAAYMAKKRAKSGGDVKGKAARPVYRGPAAAPNRFGILPGYRWDGVDRSNGFEKMYFEKQNKAVAIQEEAYKWSVSDM